jgi:hypothetical protein
MSPGSALEDDPLAGVILEEDFRFPFRNDVERVARIADRKDLLLRCILHHVHVACQILALRLIEELEERYFFEEICD